MDDIPPADRVAVFDNDDGEREYAYESVAGTFAADESITDTAPRLGWTIISIKDDSPTVLASA